ncbi:MAG: hypothetical protein IKE01_02000 [Clostridia bacterium]|nr:hypothetical protein [Clostridia bacterium]
MDVRFSMADTDGQPICPEKFFGQDAHRMENALRLIYESGVGRLYQGCYSAPCMGPISYVQAHGSADGYATYRKSWYHAHPEECQKEVESRAMRDRALDRAFKTVYGIAKSHDYFLVWEGNGPVCKPDCWRLYHKHVLIAYISV